MHMALTLFLAATLSAPALARSPKRTTAASTARADFARCVEESVLGRKDEECRDRGDSKDCIGLRRAMEYSREKSVCKSIKGDGTCGRWGHKQYAQEEWISVASGHLVRFLTCVKYQYGSEANNGTEAAAADASLRDFLQKIDDGSPALRLPKGRILVQSIEGETFGTIVKNSPFAKEFTPGELYALTSAADTPVPIPDPAGPGAAPEGGYATNPAQEESDFEALARAFIEEVIGTGAASLAKEASAPAAIAERPLASAARPAFQPTRRPKGLFSLGLDRTIFERVNDAYVRRTGSMMGTEDFLRNLKPVPPPRDMSELLRRGGSL